MGKPILIHDLYADESRPAFAPLRARRLPVFESADLVARAAAALSRAATGRLRARRALEPPARLATRRPPPELASAVAAARRRPERALTEDEAHRLLAEYGMPVPAAALARSAEAAVAAADALGYPVVLKVHAAAIVHKTDVGGVQLDLRSADDVRRAYLRVEPLVAGGAEVRLTPFRRGGVEVLAGARRDAELGPILVVGLGGVLAETMGEVAIRSVPCPDAEIEAMLDETRLGRLLSGTRGKPAVERRTVVEALLALPRLLLSVPEVLDVEVNPLVCSEGEVLALDARVLVKA